MRYFVLGDIHGNLFALNTALADMNRRFNPKFRKHFSAKLPQLKELPKNAEDCLVVVGDIVGYMPYPNQCLDKVWEKSDAIIVGNHDLAGIQLTRSDYSTASNFNESAFEAIKWTAKHLSHISKKRLFNLSTAFSWEHEGHLFTHSTPTTPEEMEYISSAYDTYYSFFKYPTMNEKMAFVGHRHIPQIYYLNKSLSFSDRICHSVQGGRIAFMEYEPPKENLGEFTFVPQDDFTTCHQRKPDKPFEKTWTFDKEWQVLVSVPSVGQPRDRFNYTGYTVYDSDKRELTMRRVPYNLRRVQARMEKLDFPQRLIDRLSEGA